jgi:hypothetical protein
MSEAHFMHAENALFFPRNKCFFLYQHIKDTRKLMFVTKTNNRQVPLVPASLLAQGNALS